MAGSSAGEPAVSRERQPATDQPLLGFVAVVALRLLALMPFRLTYHVGGFIGWVASFLPNAQHLPIRVNLDLCFPDLEPAARRRLIRKSFMHTTRNIMELGAMWLWSKKRLLRLAKEVRGDELLREVLAEGRGAILALPHIGSWELTGLYCFARYPMTALYRAPRLKRMERVYNSSRERFGGRMVPADAKGARALFQAPARGELAVMLPDQDPGRKAGVFAPFFGHPANTTRLISRLAIRSGAPVIFGYGERLPGGAGFRLHFERATPGIHDDEIEKSAGALNREVERCVCALPEQYLWAYKRFRHRPDRRRGPYSPGGSI